MNLRSVLAIVALAVAAFFLWPSGSETWRVRNQPPRDGPIVCFGDSLTSGHGVAPAQNYPAILGALLGREVVNRGRDGDTAASALERLEDDVLSLRPAVVIITLGGNDIMRRVPIDETVGAMRQIFERTLDAGAMGVFLAIDPPFVGPDRMAALRALSRALGILYVDTAMAGFWGDQKLMADRIHPNAAGYRIMAERVRDAVRAKL